MSAPPAPREDACWWPPALTPPPGGAVLQAPCGAAAWLLSPRWAAWTCVGIDPIQSNLALAREAAAEARRSVAFLPGLPWDIPFADASFELIFSAGALESALDLDAALVELTRLLTPEGRLLVALGPLTPQPGELAYPTRRRFELAQLQAACDGLALQVEAAGEHAGRGWGWIAGPRAMIP